jgi:hypothetical protein
MLKHKAGFTMISDIPSDTVLMQSPLGLQRRIPFIEAYTEVRLLQRVLRDGGPQFGQTRLD